MRSYVFAIQKGGTGKTSISVSVAVELASQGKRVLLVDGDPQGNSSSWLLDELNVELSDVFFGKVPVENSFTKTKIENLYFLPTAGINGELRNWAENVAGSKPYSFRHLIPKISEYFDYCIVDTSPSFSGLEKSLFLGVDEVIGVMQSDYFSTDGFQIFMNNINTLRHDFDSPDKPVFNKIVINSIDNRIKLQGELNSQLQTVKSFRFFSVPVDQAFKKAQILHIPVQQQDDVKKQTIEAIKEIAGSIA